MKHFVYGHKEIIYLKGKDPILGEVIDRLGMIKREVDDDIFASLISSIISQQISTKAAITVSKRFEDLVERIDPSSISKLEIEEIQKCGMSFRKAQYIKSAAEAAISKYVDFEKLKDLSDEEVIKELVKLKGVGEWTAEMLLIHSLNRPNILSYKDLAIRRGIMRIYGLDDLTKKEFEVYRQTYSPYGSVASLYIWEMSKD